MDRRFPVGPVYGREDSKKRTGGKQAGVKTSASPESLWREAPSGTDQALVGSNEGKITALQGSVKR
jgi:hypothetical protein